MGRGKETNGTNTHTGIRKNVIWNPNKKKEKTADWTALFFFYRNKTRTTLYAFRFFFSLVELNEEKKSGNKKEMQGKEKLCRPKRKLFVGALCGPNWKLKGMVWPHGNSKTHHSVHTENIYYIYFSFAWFCSFFFCFGWHSLAHFCGHETNIQKEKKKKKV